MANILVIDDDPDVRPLMKLTLNKLGHTPTLTARGEEGLVAAASGVVDVAIVDLMMPDVDGYEVIRRLRANPRTKDLPVLVLTARSQAADHESALEAGADSYLTKPFDTEELGAQIGEMLKLGQARAAGQVAPKGPDANTAGRVLVVLGLRGGVGATTFAVNLAGALARAGRRACVVDLSPAGGHVALQLRMRPKTTWADLPLMPQANTVGQALVRHDSGLAVLAAPFEPVRRSLPGETFEAVLEALRKIFADIVVDAAPVLDYPTSVALNAASFVAVVLTPEMGAVQTTLGTLRALAGLGVAETTIRVVLNQVSPEAGLAQSVVEKALGRPVDLVIPYDRTQTTALAQGTPLIFAQPAAPLAVAVSKLAARL